MRYEIITYSEIQVGDHPLSGPVGSSVCQWAFSSLDPQEISRLYGNGSPVYLA